MATNAFPAIAHVALTVSDLDRSRDWYERLIGTAPVLDENTGSFHHVVWLIGGTLVGIHQHRKWESRHCRPANGQDLGS